MNACASTRMCVHVYAHTPMNMHANTNVIIRYVCKDENPNVAACLLGLGTCSMPKWSKPSLTDTEAEVPTKTFPMTEPDGTWRPIGLGNYFSLGLYSSPPHNWGKPYKAI